MSTDSNEPLPITRTIGPNYPKAIAGAIGGAVAGAIGFWLMLQLGLYALIIPGAMIGLGCGAQSGAPSIPLAIIAAVMALCLTIFIEWYFFPFNADGSFGYFLRHLNELQPGTKLMAAAGTFAGFWFGRGR